MTIDSTDVFATEAAGGISTLERCVLELERGAASPDLLDEAFRAAHSLKGAAGLFERTGVVRVAHASEDVLSDLRGAAGPIDVPAFVAPEAPATSRPETSASGGPDEESA